MRFPTLALIAILLAGCTMAPPRPAEVARGDHAAIGEYLTDPPGQMLRIPLLPLSDSEALLPGALQDGGDTIHSVEADGKKHLAFSGYLLRKAR